MQSNEREKVAVKKEITLLGGISIIVGSMIGSGIFISPVGVLENVNSIGFSLIIWLLCGVVATFGSLTYAELGTMIPKSGAEYPYLKEAFGPIPAFLFAWTSSIVLKPSSVAIIGIVFGEYLIRPFYPNCEESPALAVKLASALCITLVAFINAQSVKIAEKVQIFFTIAKLAVLVIIVCTGAYALTIGSSDNLSKSFDREVHWNTLGIAFYQGFWAYDGWNQLNYITGELQNPYVNLPRSIMIGIPFVTIIYLFTNIAYLSGLHIEEMIFSRAVAVTFGRKFLGVFSWLIPIGVAISTFGGCNGYTLTCPRLLYTVAKDGSMPEVLAMFHRKKATPVPAIVFNTVISILVLFPNDFGTLVNYFSFSMWLFHGASAVALIVLRVKQPSRHRPYKVPIIIPIIVILVAIFLVFYPIISNPAWEYLYATLFILSGLFLYIPFVHFGSKGTRTFGSFTRFIQILLEVVPTVDESEPSFSSLEKHS